MPPKAAARTGPPGANWSQPVSREDALIDLNRKLGGWLDARAVWHTRVETDGAHTWMVWRRNLATFAPLLFADR